MTKTIYIQNQPIHLDPTQLAGYHRIFAENRFFLWHEGQNYDVPIPPLPPGESLTETAVAFTIDSVIYSLKINQRGTMRTAVFHTNHWGKSSSKPLNSPIRKTYPTTTPPSNFPKASSATQPTKSGSIPQINHAVWHYSNWHLTIVSHIHYTIAITR